MLLFYIFSSHMNEDALSCLPMEETYDKDADVIDPVEAFHIYQWDAFLVSNAQVRLENQNVPVLSKAYALTMDG